jgi:hypothetical protein
MNLETLDFTSGPTWARTRDHLIMSRKCKNGPSLNPTEIKGLFQIDLFKTCTF